MNNDQTSKRRFSAGSFALGLLLGAAAGAAAGLLLAPASGTDTLAGLKAKLSSGQDQAGKLASEGSAQVKSMGGESTEAWRTVLDDLIKRGLRRPEFLIVDGAPGLENAIAAVWHGVPVQRCTVHKHRNLLAHAPERLHEEIGTDYTDMIYAATPEEIEARRKAFIRKWRLRHRPVADSLEEAGDRLFSFARLPPSQWRSARTTNAIERLHEEFKRRIKTQTVLPSADTAAMLFWALLASGQINMRKVDGWKTIATKPIDQPIDLAA